jgi:fatty acid desaturase
MTIINATRGSLYAQLSRQVKDAGLLERRPGYYTAKISLTVSAFVGVWAAVVLLGASWWTLAVAAVMAMAYTQIAFIGHDAGHKQIFRGHRVNYLFGVALGNLAVGLSYGWWIDKHNRHHANPNHEGKDPDIAPGVLVFTSSQARPSLRRSQPLIRRFCTEHGVTYTRTGLIDSYRQVLRHLDEVGRPLQPLSAQ